MTLGGKLLPGMASVSDPQDEKGFSKIAMLLEATGGLSLSQVCAVTGLEGSTVQNWVKRGWAPHPNGKRYEEAHISRILIINALKECIKLEHIAKLMDYVNGQGSGIIRESDLYSFLCESLSKLGKVDDLSQSGVESVVESVISDYEEPVLHARVRLRKALTLMIYACVCTDVKRRTEAMMLQVLRELDPQVFEEEIKREEIKRIELAAEAAQTEPVSPEVNKPQAAQPAPEAAEETRKTIAQALREWDIARVENILKEDDGEGGAQPSDSYDSAADSGKASAAPPTETAGKPAQKLTYYRRN